MKDKRTLYEKSVQDRSSIRYILGLLVRWKQNLKYERARKIARKRGATIGEGVIISIELAKNANKNLTVGNHTSIQTNQLDLRIPLKIGNNVIIGSGVNIITVSHNIDSADWEHKYYGLEVEDYVWISTNVMVTPSCRRISYGAVVGAGSVVVYNTTPN
ncbi:MAG: acyltransferase [Rikenellaceae bacterium]